MRRRAFLAGTAAASAAPLLYACRAHDGAASAPSGASADLGDWEQVRRQFPLDYSWIHMAQFLMASHPAPVRAATVTTWYENPGTVSEFATHYPIAGRFVEPDMPYTSATP